MKILLTLLMLLSPLAYSVKTGIATSGTIGSNAIDTTSISNPVVTAALPPATVYRINSSFVATSEMKILLTLLMLLSPLAYSADTPNGAVSEFTANEELILYTVAGGDYPLKQT
jgi:hypothetical protein